MAIELRSTDPGNDDELRIVAEGSARSAEATLRADTRFGSRPSAFSGACF